jgi:hypothetical protein
LRSGALFGSFGGAIGATGRKQGQRKGGTKA